jgi:hypothetical protein
MPRFSILRFLCPLTLLALVSACSSSSPTGPSGPSTGDGTFTATVDGSSFTSAKTAALATGSNIVPGVVVIQGSQITSTTNTSSIALTLGFITGIGTYPLGVNSGTTAGGAASIETNTTSSFKSWSTDLSGAAGTVTISKLSSTEIAGTFSFKAPRSLGQSGADTSVTNGKFDVPMTGFVMGTDPGDLFKATSLNGTSFNGATIVFEGSASSFGFSGSSQKTVNGSLSITTITLVSTGAIAAGTTYPIATPQGGGPFISIQVQLDNSTFVGAQPGDVGTVTITSNTGGRLKGTFSGNLVGGVSIVGGSFDVKMQ